LRGYNLLFFFISFSSLHPTRGSSDEDMGPNLLLEATNKTLSKEGISHALCSKSQVLKGSYEVFYCSSLFQLCQMAQMVGARVKEFINLIHKLGPSNIPLTGIFFSIATIANVLDIDGEHHTGVWPSHL
jgi:hypothetical protein